MSVEEAIHKLKAESDIEFDSDVYREIAGELIGLGLNLAFFVFTTERRSACARELDGKYLTCPVLDIYLKYDVDFEQTGIDHHQGNWSDEWVKTKAVRASLNAVLKRHEFGKNHVSEHTFVFVYSLEEVAFQELGRQCKGAVRKLIQNEAPQIAVSRIFWNGRQYDVIVGSKSDYNFARQSMQTKIKKELPKLLAAADKEGHCQRYEADLQFGHPGTNQFHLDREDMS